MKQRRDEPVARQEWLARTVRMAKTPECGRHLRCRILKEGGKNGESNLAMVGALLGIELFGTLRCLPHSGGSYTRGKQRSQGG